MNRWSSTDIPDLSHKTIIVTGANSGIGLEASKVFAAKGARVILACRNLDKGQAALDEIRQANPGSKLELMALDLSSQKSVHAFAEAFKNTHQQLDILVNNAGIMMTPYQTTGDGFEGQLGTNHLGHFALTGLLFDLLSHSEAARVVTISSNGHKSGTMNFDNLMFEGGEDYSPMKAYGRSKLANMLFTLELQQRFETAESNAIAVAAHPGVSKTNLAEHLMQKWWARLLMPIFGLMMQSAEQGAWPTLRAATDPKAEGGDYFGPDGVGEMRGHAIRVEPSDDAKNSEDARKLWEISESLTGVRFG